jgi:hypothetical protein
MFFFFLQQQLLSVLASSADNVLEFSGNETQRCREKVSLLLLQEFCVYIHVNVYIPRGMSYEKNVSHPLN